MKNSILLIVWFASIPIITHGQQFKDVMITQGTGEDHQADTENMAVQPATLMPALIAATYHSNPDFNTACYLRKSFTQKINGLVLFTGGSVVGYLGIRSGMEIPGTAFIKNPFEPTRFENNESYKMALTGLVLMAGSIPYFIHSLKNKHKAGLKLTCQKTTFGATNKACKKVTGLTFAIPVGK